MIKERLLESVIDMYGGIESLVEELEYICENKPKEVRYKTDENKPHPSGLFDSLIDAKNYNSLSQRNKKKWDKKRKLYNTELNNAIRSEYEVGDDGTDVGNWSMNDYDAEESMLKGENRRNKAKIKSMTNLQGYGGEYGDYFWEDPEYHNRKNKSIITKRAHSRLVKHLGFEPKNPSEVTNKKRTKREYIPFEDDVPF